MGSPSLLVSLQRNLFGALASSCLVQVFSVSSFQSLPPRHPEVYSVESSTYCLHCLTQYCFRWQGQHASQSISKPSVSVCEYWMGLAFAWLYPSCSTLNERPLHLHTLGICFTQYYTAPNLQSDYTVYRCVCVLSVCMFVVEAVHKDKVLIKSNSVNLSNGCNQLPHCVLSSTANGCSAICYVDRYTHTSQEKWISGNKDPLSPPSLLLSSIALWCK